MVYSKNNTKHPILLCRLELYFFVLGPSSAFLGMIMTGVAILESHLNAPLWKALAFQVGCRSIVKRME